MTSENFAKDLLGAAKSLDAPAEGAKSRALEHLASKALVAATAGASAGAGVGAGVAAATAPAKLGALAWSIAAVAAIVGSAGGYGVGRATSAPPAKTIVPQPPTPTRDPAPALGAPRIERATQVVAPAEDVKPASANVCMATKLADAPPATCSQKGKPVPINIKNACGADVDVFWIDDKCEEVFHKRLAQDESWSRITQDHHVWRIRDHATHALLKEFVPQRVPGAPELVHNAPRRTLPEVVLRPGETGKDEAPIACSSAGLPTKLTIKNERDAQVVVMWVGRDCEEKYHERIEPKHSLVINGVDADSWRIRDAKTGEVVTDLVPEVPDTYTYITVP